jgi:hypothetical protein
MLNASNDSFRSANRSVYWWHVVTDDTYFQFGDATVNNCGGWSYSGEAPDVATLRPTTWTGSSVAMVGERVKTLTFLFSRGTAAF